MRRRRHREGRGSVVSRPARPAEASGGATTELSRTQLLLQLAALPDLALEAGGLTTPSPALRHVAQIIQEALGVTTAGILLREAERGDLILAGSAGPSEQIPAAAEPVLRRVFVTGEPVRVQAGDSAWRGGAAAAGSGDVRLPELLAASALMAVPIVMDGEPRGVLYVAGSQAEPFSEESLAFLAVVAGRVGLLLERAELTRAQREVERQRARAAARQEFLGIVTHELKTPVAVLRAYTELLLGRAEVAGRAEEVELLKRMQDQEERLLAMVDQVLDLQRIDAGLFPLEIARVDLGALAHRVLEGLQLTAGQVRLRADVEPGVVVRGDRRRIEQVVTNVVQNAIRFSPPGEEVLVRVSRAGELPRAAVEAQAQSDEVPAGASAAGPEGWGIVSVSDRGPGVSGSDRGRIFGRFYQGKQGERLYRGHGGLGVGLYIAREIVSRHGGVLWLEPAPPEGGGATFTFALPVAGPGGEE